MRERGIVTSANGEVITVRIGSELCDACDSGHCGIRYSKLRVRPSASAPCREGDVVDIRSKPGQVLAGMGKLFLLPAAAGGFLAAMKMPVILAVAVGAVILALVILTGNRQSDLPVVERVVTAASTRNETLFRPVLGGDLGNG